MAIDTIVEDTFVTKDRKESIILIGLGFDGLSTQDIADISGFNRQDISKLKKNYEEFLIKEIERHREFHYNFIEADRDSHADIVDNYWDVYYGFLSDLSSGEVDFWFNKYADYAISELEKKKSN